MALHLQIFRKVAPKSNRTKHCQAARQVGSVFQIFEIYLVSVAYSNTKEKLTEKERANMEIILVS